MTRTSIVAEIDAASRRARRPARRPRARGRRRTACASTSTRVHLDDAVRRLGELGVRSLVSHPPTLEELFLRHYGDELGDARPSSADRVRGDDGRDASTRELAHRHRRRSRGSPSAATGSGSSSGSRDRAASSSSTVASIKGLYPTQADLDKAARGVGGQRRRDHLQRPAAGPRHRRRPGRVPDRHVRARS